MAAKKVLSIDIGVQTTRMVEIDYRKQKPHIYNVATFETPEGAVEDGFIRNREILSVAMKEAMVNNGIRNNNVVFTVSSTKIANREVVVPLVPDIKVKGVVDANAKEYFPVDIEQYVITYTILDRIKAEKNMRLLVLAAPNTLIETYYEFSKMMGFEINAIDYVGNSSLQIMRSQISTAGTTLSVQLNESNTLINISKGDVMLLQRTVPYGTAKVMEAVLNSGEFGVSDYKEAWDKITTTTIINAKLNETGIDDAALSYMESNDDSYSQQLRVMKAKEDVTETLSYLVNNVVRVIDYFTAKFPDVKIDKINLCGPGSRISGVSNLFRNEIFLEVDTMDNIYGVEFERSVMIDNADKCLYMSAIGAAISPVDFIPKEHQVIAKKKNNNKQIMLVFVAMLIASGFLATVGIGKYVILSAAKSVSQKKADDLKKYEDLYNECMQVKDEAANVKGFYTSTLNNVSFFNVFMEEFEARFNANSAKLNEISMDDTKCEISVTVTNYDVATSMIMSLEKMSTVEQVYSWTMAKEDEEDKDKNTSGNTAPDGTSDAYIPTGQNVTIIIELIYNPNMPYDEIAKNIAAGDEFNTAVEKACADTIKKVEEGKEEK